MNQEDFKNANKTLEQKYLDNENQTDMMNKTLTGHIKQSAEDQQNALKSLHLTVTEQINSIHA
jgi:hypothetical protein